MSDCFRITYRNVRPNMTSGEEKTLKTFSEQKCVPIPPAETAHSMAAFTTHGFKNTEVKPFML